MRHVVRTALLGALLLTSAASRLAAGGASTVPQPPAAPAPAMPPQPPAPPSPPSAPEVVVDGDGVFLREGDDDSDFAMDAPGAPEGPATIRVRRHGGGGYLGFVPIWMTPELRQHFGAPTEAGVLVGKVEADGPAARAGLEVGDVVTSLDGDRVESTGKLVREVRRHRAGETMKLEVVRNRAPKTVTVTVGERPNEELRIGGMGPMRGFHWNEHGHPRGFAPPAPADFRGLEERLNELEKRLQEIEGRPPAK